MHVANSSVRANDVSDQMCTIWTARRASLSDEQSVGLDLCPAYGITKSGHGMDEHGHKHRNWRGLASAPRPTIYPASTRGRKHDAAWESARAEGPWVAVCFSYPVSPRNTNETRGRGSARRTCGSTTIWIADEVHMACTYVHAICKYCIEYGQRTIYITSK